MNVELDFDIENGILKKYTGPGGDVTIPEEVAEIGLYAFADCTGLTSVTIPAGVKELLWGAFINCENLTGVTFPNSITQIGEYTFAGCPKLVLRTVAGSVAEKYAKENGIQFESVAG